MLLWAGYELLLDNGRENLVCFELPYDGEATSVLNIMSSSNWVVMRADCQICALLKSGKSHLPGKSNGWKLLKVDSSPAIVDGKSWEPCTGQTMPTYYNVCDLQFISIYTVRFCKLWIFEIIDRSVTYIYSRMGCNFVRPPPLAGVSKWLHLAPSMVLRRHVSDKRMQKDRRWIGLWEVHQTWKRQYWL